MISVNIETYGKIFQGYNFSSPNFFFKLKTNSQIFNLTHLEYINDLKVFASNENTQFSNEIGIYFGISKCKIENSVNSKSQILDYTAV